MKRNKGYTYMHEHTTIDLSRIKNDKDTNLNCFDETVNEYKKLYDLGVRNILDLTTIGMERNIDYVKKVAQESGINILLSTGFYKEPFLPDYVSEKSVEDLAQIMIDEITVGISDTEVKACCIGEIGTSLKEMTSLEKKIFDASVLAAKETGVFISTHTTLGKLGLEQAQYFLDQGLDPSQVIIGHQDLCEDLDQIINIINLGFTVGFDTIGKNNYFPDEKRAEFIKVLQDKDLISNVVLSMDITRKSNLEYMGGIGYSYLIESFLPLLKSKGVSEESIEKMLITNPQRFLEKVI
ncbi:MAG TPA: hypothetical protein VFC83_01970 [Erysipelotrichaceae bacterium]|nr:hypothetical protein [Erysipelotrichaceae bacterium]